MATLLIGLGANQRHPQHGAPRTVLQAAIAAIAAHPDFVLIAASRLYQTKPVGPKQPMYVNAVVRVTTRLSPQACLAQMHALEHRFARVRRKHWGPRTLDLDILSYGPNERSLILPNRLNWHKKSTLTIPHPQLHHRSFVLAPLAEIAPLWRHPILHRRACHLFFCSSKRGLFSAILSTPPR
jgi:2-amino-4-hydroxy-6-hydroxymethyldihydropteridine diphosphokinase